MKVYIIAQYPTVVIHNTNHFLCINAIQRDKKRGKDTKESTKKRKFQLALRTNIKSRNHNSTADNYWNGRSDSQKQKSMHNNLSGNRARTRAPH